LAEIEKPEPLQQRGGVWFRLGEQQLHVGVERDFAAARKAHPALRVSAEAIDGLAGRLSAAEVPVAWDDALGDTHRFYSEDPWGNRIEFITSVTVREDAGWDGQSEGEADTIRADDASDGSKQSKELPAGLAPGSERYDEFTVDGLLLTDVGGTISANVLSTPGIIAMMEGNATALVYEHLPAEQATVGFEVCVKHVAAAGQGAVCQVRATLREMIEGRKLRFEVEVSEGERTIGVGTHERRVIAVDQLNRRRRSRPPA
jgi:fluoroacetyl-CoA thioesterase